MADFVAPQFQNPNFLQSYLAGQQAADNHQTAQQDQQFNGLKMDQLKMAMQNQQLMQQYAKSLATGTQAPDGQGPGAFNAPAAGQGSTQSTAAGMGGQSSYGGSSVAPGYAPQQVNTMMALDALAGRDPMATAEKAQTYQKQQAQLQAQGPLNLFETLARSPDANKIVMNNPQLQAQWRQVAPQMGIDPNDPTQMTVANVQKVAAFGYNGLAGKVGLPPKDFGYTGTLAPGTVAYQNGQQVAGDPNGMSAFDRGKLGIEAHNASREDANSPLEKVIGSDGQPMLVPRSKAVGMTPFNEQAATANNISDQAKEFAYQQFATTGKMPAIGRGGAAAQAAYANYFAKRAEEDGNSGAAMAARAQSYQATSGVVKDFESGKQSQAINGINTAVGHMAALEPLADALNNGDSQTLNKLGNKFNELTGKPAPTNFAAMKEFVAGEVAKAVLPGGGGEAERAALTAPLNAANSPEQLKGAIAEVKEALAKKTDAMRNQWDIGTNGSQGSFDKFLLPATKEALGIKPSASPGGKTPPPTNAQGWQLHKDAQGRMAYVSPDGKQFQKVQ